MMRQSTLLVLGSLCILFVGQAALRTSGQEQVPLPLEMSDREVKLEHELLRLQDVLAGMGENHPHLKLTQKRISELQAELVAMSRGAGPFAEALAADRTDVDKLLRQMSDHEVRQAVLHLFGQVKDLQRRIERLEAAN